MYYKHSGIIFPYLLFWPYFSPKQSILFVAFLKVQKIFLKKLSQMVENRSLEILQQFNVGYMEGIYALWLEV